MTKKALKIVAKQNIDYTYNGKVVGIKKGDEFILYGKVFAYKDALIDITPIIDLFETTVLPEQPTGLPKFEMTENLQLISSVDGSAFLLEKGTKFTTVNDIVWFADGVILNIAEHTDCIKFIGYSGDVQVESVEIDYKDDFDYMVIGDEVQCTVTIEPEEAADVPVTWQSSDENVATVTADGLLTCIAPGEFTLTAIAGDKSESLELSVIIPIQALSIANKAELQTINAGEQHTIVVEYTPEDTDVKDVTVESSDETVVAVNYDAEQDIYSIQGLKSGEAVVTVTSTDNPEAYDTVNVTVNEV